jgi:hypothetical protein
LWELSSASIFGQRINKERIIIYYAAQLQGFGGFPDDEDEEDDLKRIILKKLE